MCCVDPRGGSLLDDMGKVPMGFALPGYVEPPDDEDLCPDGCVDQLGPCTWCNGPTPSRWSYDDWDGAYFQPNTNNPLTRAACSAYGGSAYNAACRIFDDSMTNQCVRGCLLTQWDTDTSSYFPSATDAHLSCFQACGMSSSNIGYWFWTSVAAVQAPAEYYQGGPESFQPAP
jgi:hypothetical protein